MFNEYELREDESLTQKWRLFRDYLEDLPGSKSKSSDGLTRLADEFCNQAMKSDYEALIRRLWSSGTVPVVPWIINDFVTSHTYFVDDWLKENTKIPANSPILVLWPRVNDQNAMQIGELNKTERRYLDLSPKLRFQIFANSKKTDWNNFTVILSQGGNRQRIFRVTTDYEGQILRKYLGWFYLNLQVPRMGFELVARGQKENYSRFDFFRPMVAKLAASMFLDERTTFMCKGLARGLAEAEADFTRMAESSNEDLVSGVGYFDEFELRQKYSNQH